MGFPGQTGNNPWRVSEAVNTAGVAQDVVIAASRMLHGLSLSERDWKALETCRDLLRDATSAEPAASMPRAERHLEPVTSVLLLRVTQCARHDQLAQLEHAVDMLDSLIARRNDQGELTLDADSVTAIKELRDFFLAVGEANLRSMTATSHKSKDLGSWKPLITSSPF
jgi:hypothetical protein